MKITQEQAPLGPQAFAPGSYGCHEALHATSLVVDLIETAIIDHPAIQANKDWLAKALAAHQILFDLYQEIGEKHLPGESG